MIIFYCGQYNQKYICLKKIEEKIIIKVIKQTNYSQLSTLSILFISNLQNNQIIISNIITTNNRPIHQNQLILPQNIQNIVTQKLAWKYQLVQGKDDFHAYFATDSDNNRNWRLENMNIYTHTNIHIGNWAGFIIVLCCTLMHEIGCDTLYSFEASATHYLYFNLSGSNNYLTYRQYNAVTNTWQSSTTDTTALPPSQFQIATSALNTPLANKLNLFSSLLVYQVSNMTLNPTPVLELSSPDQIYDVVMSDLNHSIYFVLSKQVANSQFFVTMVSNGINITRISSGIVEVYHDGMMVTKGNILLALMECNISIYSYNNTGMSQISSNLVWTTTGPYSLDIHPNNLTYLFANDTIIYLFSMLNYTQIYNYSYSSINGCNNLRKVQFVFDSYLLISCQNGKIVQLDYDNNLIIRQFNTDYDYFGWISAAAMFVNAHAWSTGTDSANVGMFGIIRGYNCSANYLSSTVQAVCPSCVSGYGLTNLTVCLKNTLTNITVNVTVNTTNMTNTTVNGTANGTTWNTTTNSSNTTNNSTNINTTNTTYNAAKVTNTNIASINGTINSTTINNTNTTTNNTNNTTNNSTNITNATSNTTNSTTTNNNTNNSTGNSMVNTTNNATTNNTNNITNTTNTSSTKNNTNTNSNSNSNISDTSTFTQVSDDAQIGQDVSALLQSQKAIQIASATTKVLSIASVRISPKPLLALACFLDDLDGYQYHHTSYPVSMTAFLNKINLMNQIRFMPWFFDFLGNVSNKMKQNTNFSADWNQKYVDFQNYTLNNDPNQVYFLNAVSDVYTVTLLQNIFIFGVLKLLHGIFYLLQKKCRLFQTAYLKIMVQTKWWTLIITIVQANMVNLAFSCALQLKMASYFTVQNKANFGAMVMVLLLLIVYAVCFYPVVYEYSSLKFAEVLLQRSSFFYARSFRYQPIYLVSRKLIRALINGLFIFNYQALIIALMLVDIVSLSFIVRIRKIFRNGPAFIFTLIYSAVFVAFDSFFAFELLLSRKYQRREMFGLVAILMFIFCSLAILLALLLPELWMRLKMLSKIICRSSRVKSLDGANVPNNDNNFNMEGGKQQAKKNKIFQSFRRQSSIELKKSSLNKKSNKNMKRSVIKISQITKNDPCAHDAASQMEMVPNQKQKNTKINRLLMNSNQCKQ